MLLRKICLLLLIVAYPLLAEPFPLDLVGSSIEMDRDTTPVIDPSGSWLAYAVSLPAEERVTSLRGGAQYYPSWVPTGLKESRLRVIDLKTGSELSVGPPGQGAFRCSWSPDGKCLAFYVDEGDRVALFVAEAPEWTGHRVTDLALHPNRRAGDEPNWIDNRTVIVPAALPGTRQWLRGLVHDRNDETPQHFYTPTETDLTPNDYWDKMESIELFRVDVETGSATSLGGPERPISLFRLSPSGRYLIAGSVPGAKTSRLYLKDLGDSGDWKALTDLDISFYEGWGSATQVQWHPTRDRLFVRANLKLLELDIQDGTRRQLNKKPFSYPFGFSPDGRLVYALQGSSSDPGVFSSVHEDLHLVLIPIDSGEAAVLPLPKGSTEIIRFAADEVDVLVGGQVYRMLRATGRGEVVLDWSGSISPLTSGSSGSVLLLDSIQSPPDLYLLSGKALRRLSHMEERLIQLPPVTVKTLHTSFQRDGKNVEVKTSVCLPHDYDPKSPPPAVVNLYPGDLSSRGARTFSGPSVIPTSVFTSRGYAVVYCDTPISPPGEPGEPLRELVDIVEPQLAKATELDLVDSKRLAVLGHSHGAYAAASMCAGSDKFRAGIALMGIYDLSTGYSGGVGEEESFEGRGQYRMGVSPWSDPQKYLRNSPYQLAPNIQCPIFLAAGENDAATPYWQSVFLWNSLRSLGRQAELHLYPGEDHVPAYWSRKHRQDLLTNLVRFLEENL